MDEAGSARRNLSKKTSFFSRLPSRRKNALFQESENNSLVTATRNTKEVVSIITDAIELGAEEAGIRLEYVNSLPIWEASPVYRHQKKALDIQVSLLNYANSSGCKCLSVADLSILFPDGSLKRPDISIFCEEPEQQDTACTQIPDAVIEILSKGYEKKDMEISLPFYLAQGLADVVIFDPATNRVTHYHGGRTDAYESPVELTFACGCRATV